MEKRYLKPLLECSKILDDADDVNYIILVSDAIKDDIHTSSFAGGSGWNVEYPEGGPDFLSMVGGLVENFLAESKLSYTEKLKLIRAFTNNIVMNVTNKED